MSVTPDGLGTLLFQKQIDSFAYSDGKINVWDGSIRAGKTIVSLLRWLTYVAQAPSNGELIIAGKTLQSIYRNVFAPLFDPDLLGSVATEIHYVQGAPVAYFFGRQVHIVGAADAKAETKIRGMTGAGAYVDEATLVPRDFFFTLLGRLSVPGAQLFATTNPDTPAHWLRKEILLSGSPDVRRFRFKIDDNVFLPPEYVAWIKSTFRGLYYRRNILGQWVVAEGAVYDMWSDRFHVVAQLPAMHSYWISIDYGTSNPFHALLFGLGADGRIYVCAEWRYDGRTQMRQMTDSEYADALFAWIKVLGTRPGFRNLAPTYWIVDPSAASFRAELRRRGVVQVAADNDVIDGIRLCATMLGHRKLKIHGSCKHLIDEIMGYSWDDKAALLGEDKPIKVEDHGPDAMRYGVRSTRRLWLPHVGLGQLIA